MTKKLQMMMMVKAIMTIKIGRAKSFHRMENHLTRRKKVSGLKPNRTEPIQSRDRGRDSMKVWRLSAARGCRDFWSG